MYLRKLRLLAAVALTTAAVAATPAKSDAAVQVLIEQYLIETGAAIGPTVILTQNGTGILPFTASTSAAWNASGDRHFATVGVSVDTNSGSPSTFAAITNQVSVTINPNYDGSRGIRLVVTDDGFSAPPGYPFVSLQNSAGASNSLGVDINGKSVATVDGRSLTELFTAPLPAATNSTQTDAKATGTPVNGTRSDTAVNLNPGGLSENSTFRLVATELNQFAVQQTIEVFARENPNQTIDNTQALKFGGTFGLSVRVTTTAVPAPAGLVLALTALPVFGLRRFLRRKGEPVAAA